MTKEQIKFWKLELDYSFYTNMVITLTAYSWKSLIFLLRQSISGSGTFLALLQSSPILCFVTIESIKSLKRSEAIG